MKYIFEEIITTSNIFMVIESHFEDEDEKEHMKNVVRDTVHHKLLDLVLDELDPEKRTLFLAELEDEDKHNKLLEKLRVWIENFEEKLHIRAKESEEEMMRLIKVE